MCGCLTLERSLPRASVKPQPLNGQCWPLGGPQQARAQRSGPSHPQPSPAPGHTPPTCLVTPRLEAEAPGAVFTAPLTPGEIAGEGFTSAVGPGGQEAPEQSGQLFPQQLASGSMACRSPANLSPPLSCPLHGAGTAIFLAVTVAM